MDRQVTTNARVSALSIVRLRFEMMVFRDRAAGEEEALPDTHQAAATLSQSHGDQQEGTGGSIRGPREQSASQVGRSCGLRAAQIEA